MERLFKFFGDTRRAKRLETGLAETDEGNNPTSKHV